MKLLLLFALIAACTAARIVVNDDGSSSIFSTVTGRRVFIQREIGPNGQRFVEVSVYGPRIQSQSYQYVDNSEGTSQIEILSQIFKEYQGVATPAQYQRLLSRVQAAVTQGEINPQIYELLQGLVQNQYNSIWQQGLYGPGYERSFYQNLPSYLQVLFQGRYPYQSSGLLANQQYYGQVPQYQKYYGQQPFFNYLFGLRRTPYQSQYSQQVPYEGYEEQTRYTPYYYGQYQGQYEGQQYPYEYYGPYSQQYYGQQGYYGQQRYYGQQGPYYSQQYYGPYSQQYYGQEYPYYQQYYGQQYPYYQRYFGGAEGSYNQNQGLRGLFSYLYNLPYYQAYSARQPYSYQSQGYLQNYQVPQLAY